MLCSGLVDRVRLLIIREMRVYRYVVETIAKEREMAWEEIAKASTANAMKLFRFEERGLK